jgi:hypothetical protein
MVDKTRSRGAGKRRVGVKRSGRAAQEKPRALTLKVDNKLYVRLRMLGARQLRTHQDILEDALKEYLTREGA